MVLTHRWRKALLIPCVAFAAATLQQGMGPADSVAGQRDGTLTDAQKQQLFQTRRRWELDSYDQRLALLNSGRDCTERARTTDAFRVCKQEQRQALRRLFREGQQVMNAERRRLGLPLLPERRSRRSQGSFGGEPHWG
jgi:hypothetical protein